MQFINTDLETILIYLNKLEQDSKPKWGNMTAQRMVEHLTESINMSTGNHDFNLLIPESKVESMQELLNSDSVLPRNFDAAFVDPNKELSHSEIELAIDELVEKWMDFEEYYEENPTKVNLHPYYGQLNYDQWLRMHAKHFTHHFEQFDLL